MATVCVSVPDEMKQRLEQFETINWSAVARQAFAAQLSKLELMDKLTEKSKAADRDIEALSKKIKSGVAKWHNRAV